MYLLTGHRKAFCVCLHACACAEGTVTWRVCWAHLWCKTGIYFIIRLQDLSVKSHILLPKSQISDLSWGPSPRGSFVPRVLLGHGVWGKRQCRAIPPASVTPHHVWLKQGGHIVHVVFFPGCHLRLDCFRGELGKILQNDGVLWISRQTTAFFLMPFPPYLPLHDDQGWGHCPNRLYISEWWSLSFPGLAEETFQSPLLNIEHHLGVNEFWQQNLVLQLEVGPLHFLLIFLYN